MAGWFGVGLELDLHIDRKPSKLENELKAELRRSYLLPFTQMT